MVNPKSISVLLLHSALAFLSVEIANAQGLNPHFYKSTCPNVTHIVRKKMNDTITRDRTLAAPLLRMHFHDCFVMGCDASVLLDSTNGNKAEKEAIPNQSLRGFEVIDEVKAVLENHCPGIVSCADILALVAERAVRLTGGPSWQVFLGRRDGKVSRVTEAVKNIPSPLSNITVLKQNFADVKLNETDLAALSGAHTIGRAHCFTFATRLYNFTGENDKDPSLDREYARKLQSACPPQASSAAKVEMDPGSFTRFDTAYYSGVAKDRGVLGSDAALLKSEITRKYVRGHASYSSSSTTAFFRDFAKSMVKMGNIGVLTGTQGEIRKICSRINN
ncbi:unnamed protein product [Cuscuta epithymum]|uniref:Peroxidase n=1 Tax=Cuscuta epithymum TaxID=186058 RepID=A0AAV0EF07_9ASTE|nr:unnamed protein product [Cuscuta epithymum]